jgi:stage II sporulation protein D
MLKSIFLILALTLAHNSRGNIPNIHVLLGSSLSFIKIKGENLKKIYKHRLFEKNYQGEQTITMDCSKKVDSTSWNGGLLQAELTASSGIIEWKNNKYHGEFTVVRRKEKKGCDLIHEIPLEHYISTLVGKEMGKKWPLEALKAQAVAARSYALYKQKSRKASDDSEQLYDLINSEKDQVNGSLSDVTPETLKAAYSTQGEVLTNKEGEIIPIFYHSKCGGRTHLPENVWGNKVEGYKEIDCPFCKQKGKESWIYSSYSKKFLKQLLDLAWSKNTFSVTMLSASNFTLLPNDKFSETFSFKFRSQIFHVKKSAVRKLLGRDKLSSNNFTVAQQGETLEFKGEGLGHGVGMCQIGARELASRGYSYKDILSFYYPDFKLQNNY